MNDEMFSRAFKALGDPTRLQIVTFISHCCCQQAAIREDGAVEGPTAGEVCCHVTGADKINSTISHHLHELADAGLIKLEKKGKATLCILNNPALQVLALHLVELAEGKEENCCDVSEGCC